MITQQQLLEIPGIKISTKFCNPQRSGEYEVIDEDGRRGLSYYDKCSGRWRFHNNIKYWIAPDLKSYMIDKLNENVKKLK